MILPDRLLHIFHWPGNYPIRLMLPAMIAASLLLHAGALYLVRAAPSARGISLSPAQAKLTVFPAGQGSVLLAASDPSWLEPGRWRDRLIPVPRAPREVHALEPKLPGLVQAPAPASAADWVPSVPPLSAKAWIEPGGGRTPPPVLNPVTARFAGDGPAVTADLFGRLHASAPSDPPGLPTELLVVLDAAGEARHVWLVRSCGVPPLDLAAQLAVQRSRFGLSERGFRGILRVVWGSSESPTP